VGKDADLVIYDKHPLSVFTVPQKVLIDGIVYFDRQKDIALRAEIEKEKKALMEKEKKAAEPAGGPGRRPGGPGRQRPAPPSEAVEGEVRP